jgi:threonine dehydratase
MSQLPTHTQLFQEILLACQRVYVVAGETPLEIMPAPQLPFKLFLKREDLGPVKAYKWRGAYNRMALLDDAACARGVTTASAGNHAQGVALAASHLDVNARVFMPKTTPHIKQDAVRRFGGERVEIILEGESYDGACRVALEDAARTGRTFIHAYDDLHVIAGQGTIAVEIARAAKVPLHAAVLQIGGGGMAAGVACWLKHQYPGIRIYGVEVEGQACMSAAFQADSPVELETVDIFCDGTAVKRAGDITHALCRELVDELVLVTNDEVCRAMQTIWDASRAITETSGAVGVAGALKLGERLAGLNVLAVLTGANIDFGKLGSISGRTTIGGAARRHLRLQIPERPGALLRVLDTVFAGRSITDFQYGKTRVAAALFSIGVAVDDAGLRELSRNLEQHGIPSEDATGRDDITFRVIRCELSCLLNPLFLRLDFYERAGALRDFLAVHITSSINICYFNYAYTGERIGRALIGLEFPDPAARSAFANALPTRGTGFRGWKIVNPPAVTLGAAGAC